MPALYAAQHRRRINRRATRMSDRPTQFLRRPKMLTVGDKLPDFTVPVQQGVDALPAGETLSQDSFPGKWKVLFYWPKDFTFVCPTEIVGYAALKDDFADRDAVLIGASTDTSHVHFAWRKSDPDLAAADFPWLADNGATLASALGILDKDAHVAYR